MRAIRPLLFLLVAIAACSDRGTSGKSEGTTMLFRKEDQGADAAMPSSAPPAMTAASPSAAVAAMPAPTQVWSTQKLIRNAELRIQVRDVPKALRMADSMARSQQALLADSRTSRDDDGKRSADVVIRVPSAQFAALLRALSGLGDVQEESVSTQDVTREYADLETRLAVKEQTVTRLRALLEHRTAKLADVLEVERELGRAVAELEQMKGERRFLDQQVALSTVRLTLFERVPSQLSQVTRPISDALRHAMLMLGRSIGTMVYLTVAALPWVLAGLAIVWLIRPLRRRLLSRRARPASPAG